MIENPDCRSRFYQTNPLLARSKESEAYGARQVVPGKYHKPVLVFHTSFLLPGMKAHAPSLS